MTGEEHYAKGEAFLTNVHALLDYTEGKAPWPRHLPPSSHESVMTAINGGTALAAAHFAAAQADFARRAIPEPSTRRDI